MANSFPVKIGNVYSTMKMCGETDYTAETTLSQAVKDAFATYMIDKTVIDESVDGVIEIEYNVVGYDEANNLVISAKTGVYSDGNALRGVIFIMSLRSIGMDASDVWGDTEVYAFVPEDQENLLLLIEWAREMKVEYVNDLTLRLITALKSFSDWDAITI